MISELLTKRHLAELRESFGDNLRLIDLQNMISISL